MKTHFKALFVVIGMAVASSGAAMAQLVLDENLQRSLESPLSSHETLVGGARLVELEAGSTKEFVFPVDPSEKYTIYGGCDDDCDDINLVAQTDAGAVIDIDEEDDAEPLVKVLPGQSNNEVRVTLSMKSCATGTCIAGVAMFRSR